MQIKLIVVVVVVDILVTTDNVSKIKKRDNEAIEKDYLSNEG